MSRHFRNVAVSNLRPKKNLWSRLVPTNTNKKNIWFQIEHCCSILERKEICCSNTSSLKRNLGFGHNCRVKTVMTVMVTLIISKRKEGQASRFCLENHVHIFVCFGFWILFFETLWNLTSYTKQKAWLVVRWNKDCTINARAYAEDQTVGLLQIFGWEFFLPPSDDHLFGMQYLKVTSNWRLALLTASRDWRVEFYENKNKGNGYKKMCGTQWL